MEETLVIVAPKKGMEVKNALSKMDKICSVILFRNPQSTIERVSLPGTKMIRQ